MIFKVLYRIMILILFSKNNKKIISFLFLFFVLTSQAQQTYSFTNAGATGRLGPTQLQINSAYAATNLNGLVTSNNGVQTFTIPTGGSYRIEAWGASGGSALYSGKGTKVIHDVTIPAGTVLKIVVGQMGSSYATSNSDGGGGGSFVGPLTGGLYVAAGGGGGSAQQDNVSKDGQLTTSVINGSPSQFGSAAAGYSVNGAHFTYAIYTTVGQSFTNGSNGQMGGQGAGWGGGGIGWPGGTYGEGGFGGGGSSCSCSTGGGGGGGGYVGGGGGGGSYVSGFGGSSFGINQPSNYSVTVLPSFGHGLVIITQLNSIDPCQLFAKSSPTSAVCAGSQVTLGVSAGSQNSGNGSDGSITISSTTNANAVKSSVNGIIGIAGSNSIALTSASGFSVGNEVLIITMQDATVGANNLVGKYELKTISAISSNTLIFSQNLLNTYTASATLKHQIIKVPQYTNVTINSGGVLTCDAWNGTVGGVLCFKANGLVTINAGGSINANGKGYRAVAQKVAYWTNADGGQGEGIYGTGIGSGANGGSGGNNAGAWLNANGNGGGGGTGMQDAGGGGGGGYGVSGIAGTNGGHSPGLGGLSVGNSSVTVLIMGGAGGEGGADEDGGYPGAGGNGGGIVAIYTNTLIVNGNLTSNGIIGNNGGGGGGCGMGGGGGGAGGSINLIINSFSGTSANINALSGAGGLNNGCGGVGGNGGNGRIRIDAPSPLPVTNPAAYQGTNIIASGVAYSWSNGSVISTSNSVVVSPSVTTNYTITVTTTSGCSGASSVIAVNVNPNPTITLNSGAICVGQNFTINPSGANTYTIQGGNAVVSPPSNANYTVIGTNTVTGCVSQAVATSSLIVNPNPIITVNNGTICAGQNFTINPNGANTYTIQGGNAVVSPSSNVNYTVIGTSTAGCLSQAVATSSLIVNPNPNITLNTSTICAGNSLTLNSISPASGGVITYSNGYTIHTFTSSSAFIAPSNLNVEYLVVGGGGSGGINTAGNGGGGGAGGFLSGIINNLPASNYSITVGSGGSIGNNGGNSSFHTYTAIGGGKGGWYLNNAGSSGGSGGGGGQHICLGGAGTSGQGNAGGNAVGPNGLGAAGGGGAGAIGNNSYGPSQASGGYGGAGLISSITGNAVYYAGGGGGSSHNSSPVLSLGGIGGGGNGHYGGTTATNGQPNTGGGGGGGGEGYQPGVGGSGIVIIKYQTVSIASYTWSTGSNTSSISISPTLTSNYSVSVTSTAGCIGTSNTATVNVNPLPVLSISGSSAICVGQTATLIANGATTYTWSNASTSSSITSSPAINTSYSLAGTSSAGCLSQAFATSNLTVNPNPTITVNNGSICVGQNFTINPNGANTYTIQGGSSVVNPPSNAIYTVVGTSTAGCASQAFATSSLIVNPNPIITVNSGSICAGQSFTINPNGANTYTIQGGNAVVSPSINTTYTVIGTSTAGCVSQAYASSTLIINPNPIINISGSSPICIGNSATLIPVYSGTVQSLSIGQNYQGGKIVYIDGSGQSGLIAAPTDQGSGSFWHGSNSGLTGATGVSIGTGNANTNSIIALYGPEQNVARICYDLVLGGYSDWYLPSKDELNQMYIHRVAIGNFSGNSYWSSTEFSASNAWTQDFSNGNQTSLYTKYNGHNFRAVRSFTVPAAALSYTWSNGANTASIIVNPTVSTSYSVTLITPAGCIGSSTLVTVNVNPLPVVTITGTNAICAGGSTTLTANGANLYLWSTAANVNSIVVSPIANTVYSVSGTSSLGCTGTAAVTTTVYSLPIVSITGTNAICSGQSSTLIANGANSYVWSNSANSNSIVVSPLSNTSYSVVGTNTLGCIGNSSIINLTVNPLPIVSITGTNALCVGSSVNLSAVGANTYTWNTGSNTAILSVSPSVNTSYSLAGTSSLGCLSSNTAILAVTVNTLPIVVFTGTNAICVGGSAIITAGGASTYSWNTGANTASISVSPVSNTNYIATGISALGCVGSAVRAITVYSLPIVSITGTNAICSGQSSTLIANGANTYTWLPGPYSGSSFSVNPSSNLTYSLIGTNLAGCTNSNFALQTVSVIPLPTVSISTTGGVPTNSSVAICYGSPITFVPSGANTYSWNGQGSWVGFSPTVTTNYIFVGQNTLTGCTSTNAPSQLITVNALPSLTISASNSIICPGYATTLNISGASNYTWYPGGFTIPSIIQNPTITTTYSVIGINAISGCTNMAINTVSVYGLPILTASAISASICMNSSTTLSGFGANTYTWYPGGISGNTIQVSPTTQTTYTLIGTNLAGCSSTNTSAQIISVIPLPIVGANVSNSIICFGSSVTLNGSGANTYTWSGNVSNGALFSPTTTLSYTVNGTNTLTGCTSTNSPSQLITVNALPIVSVTPINAFICVGNISTLTAIGAQTYSWFPGNQLGSPLFISPNVTTTYSLVGTNSLGCISTNLAIQTITVNSIPTVSASISNSIICSGQTSTLLAFGANTYTWYPGSISTGSLSIISPTTSSSYSLVGTSLAGCTSTNVLIESIIVNSLPTITINSSSIAVCSGNTLTLLGNGANTYTWSGNILNNTPFIPMITDTYTVIGTDQNGCDNSAIISITVNTTPTVIATSTSSAVCIGDSTQLTASGAFTYTWNPNNFTGINYTVSPINTSTYNLIGISAEGCISSNTAIISITVNPLPIVTANVSNSVICLGQFLTLNGLGANTYSWSSGVFNNVPFTPSASASYTLTGIDANGCFNKFTTITTTVNSLPIINVASSNSVICESESATLTASGAISYTWNTSSNASSLVLPAKPAAVYVYSVQGTNENGCINLKTYAQSVLECPGVFSVSPISTSLTCSDRGPILGNIKLDENITYQNKEVSYNWKPANLCPTNDCASIENLGAGKYGLTIKVTYTISPLLIRTDSIVFDLIEVKDIDGPCGIKIYNGITPNGDKINDTWKIENIAGYPNNKVMIFSRWGKQLAEINGYNNDDKAWPVGDQIDKLISSTYFYLIDLQGDGKKIEKGWIEVIK